MRWWVGVGLIAMLFIWFRGVVRALRQRGLTNALIKLQRRIDLSMTEVSSPSREKLPAAVGSSSQPAAGSSTVFTPGAWLRGHLETARATILSIEPVIDRLPVSETTALTAILDSEQRLLARSKVAFSSDTAYCACRHHRSSPTMEVEQLKKMTPQIHFRTNGNRAYSRNWCRHCLIAFESQWEIAVSGGH